MEPPPASSGHTWTHTEISDFFLKHLAAYGLQGMKYGALWQVLRENGALIRGRSAKNQKDTVYTALSQDDRILRESPGYFVPR